ncbi:hypothetical protein ONZ45_g15354 [Pleurotus djamor]|nr:hypothetical protein ONZ45_g15354 [Pleurotus djamor]
MSQARSIWSLVCDGGVKTPFRVDAATLNLTQAAFVGVPDAGDQCNLTLRIVESDMTVPLCHLIPGQVPQSVVSMTLPGHADYELYNYGNASISLSGFLVHDPQAEPVAQAPPAPVKKGRPPRRINNDGDVAQPPLSVSAGPPEPIVSAPPAKRGPGRPRRNPSTVSIAETVDGGTSTQQPAPPAKKGRKKQPAAAKVVPPPDGNKEGDMTIHPSTTRPTEKCAETALIPRKRKMDDVHMGIHLHSKKVKLTPPPDLITQPLQHILTPPHC